MGRRGIPWAAGWTIGSSPWRCGPDGSLYAGGDFTTAGGVAANYIARWDGTTWHPLGSGIEGTNSSVSALAVGSGGSLYAGGWFTTAGGVAANRIARWDGTAWHSLDEGIDGEVDALAVDGNGNLFAGGNFSTAGGIPSSYIACWTGEVEYKMLYLPLIRR